MQSTNTRSIRLSDRLLSGLQRNGILGRLVAAVVPALALASTTAYFGWNLDLAGSFSSIDLCPFQLVADVTCPGCGMMRGIIRLGQLRFVEAWTYHPFSYPVLLGTTLFAGYGCLPWPQLHRRVAGLSLGLLLVLWFYRALFMS